MKRLIRLLVVAAVMSAAAAGAQPARPHMRVLMVGNSYTYYHDLPHMLVQIAAADRDGPYVFDVVPVTKGAAHLSDFVSIRQVSQQIAALQGGALVLQDQSMVALNARARMQSAAAIENLAAQARAAGAKTLIYGTWPRRAGDDVYAAGSQLSSPQQMQADINAHYLAAARRAQTGYVAVGDYFVEGAGVSGLPLYAQDLSHPSLEGSYLAALLLYRCLSGRMPDALTWQPAAMDASHAAGLRALASKPSAVAGKGGFCSAD